MLRVAEHSFIPGSIDREEATQQAARDLGNTSRRSVVVFASQRDVTASTPSADLAGSPVVPRNVVDPESRMAATTASLVVRPTHAVRTRARSPAGSAAPKSAAMSGVSAPAPAFLGAKPAQLSAGIVAGRSGAGTRSVATMGLFGLGLPELVVIGGVAAVLFGPSKLPELGKSLGKTVKSFQAAASVSPPHPTPNRDNPTFSLS